MKFKVSAKVKGSLILKSLGRAVSSGTTVFVEGNTLYADDVQRAIKSGLLVSLTPEAEIEVRENIINKSSEVVIINKTDRVVIVGNFPIRPNGSAIKEIDSLDMNAIKKCVETGLIQVITEVDNDFFDKPASKKKSTVKKVEKEKTELETGIEILEETSGEISMEEELRQLVEESEATEKTTKTEDNDKESKAVVWDFRAQETKEPETVPKTSQQLLYDENEEEDIDMVDAIDEVNEVEEEDKEIQLISDKIESMKKQLAKKKASKKKTSKKKDPAFKKPKFTRESDEDIAQPLDSMGKPLTDDMTHMIDDANGKEISFCDQEQAQKNIENAKKQGNSINLDLD